MNLSIVFDASIRILMVAIKGAFVFAAARYLDLENFGLYISISAIVSLLQYIVAGDYSYIAHRELFVGRAKLDEILGTQVVLLGTLFLLTSPILLYMLPEFNEKKLPILALGLLLLESITSELQRHLIAISEFTISNLIIFIKSAGWMMPAWCLLYLDKEFRNIDAMIISWTLGLLASLALGIFGIIRKDVLRLKVNKNLLLKYLNIVPVVLVGTVATRSLFSLDRIVIEKFVGLEMSGIYGLYVGIAAAFVAIIDAGILTRSYAELVKSAVKCPENFKSLSRQIQTLISITTFFGVIVYYLTINTFLFVISKPDVAEYLHVGALLIVAYGIYSLSFPFNCKMYAFGKDKTISLINIISLFPLVIVALCGSVTIDVIVGAVFACAALHYLLRLRLS